VKTQVWFAVATDVLIAIVKKKLQPDASLYTCLHFFVSLGLNKTQISFALQSDASQTYFLDAN